MKRKSQTLRSFRLGESRQPLLELVVALVVLLALAAFLMPNPSIRRWAFYLLIVLVGSAGLFALVFVSKRVLSKSLIASWSGKWDASILGKYLGPREQTVFARLVASRRWEFNAVPSVRKVGITIELKGKRVRDKDLASLSQVSTVHVLVLADCRGVTDAGLAHLVHLTCLECLVLSRTSVTNAGLQALRSLPALKTLDVDGTSVSDSALRAAGLLQNRFSLAAVEREVATEQAAAPSDVVPESLEVVAMNRRLAAMRPDACLPDLAISLNNLGWGRTSQQAVSALQESVEINRSLVATRSTEHRPALYNSLSNLGVIFEKRGQYEDALAATQEAVDVVRQIPSTQPSADTALVLHRLGSLYSKYDRHEEAVQAILESAEMYRHLVAAAPDAMTLRSWFVNSLNDLSTGLHELGRTQEALAAATEAAQFTRHAPPNGTT